MFLQCFVLWKKFYFEDQNFAAERNLCLWKTSDWVVHIKAAFDPQLISNNIHMDITRTLSLTTEKAFAHILLFPYADICEGVTFSQHDICFQKWAWRSRSTTNKTFIPNNNKTITTSLKQECTFDTYLSRTVNPLQRL